MPDGHRYPAEQRDAVYRVIAERRDVRRGFLPDPVPADVLGRVLAAAHQAPSVGFSQPWDFIVVTDRRQLTELAKVWRAAGHVARSAATIAMIAPSDRLERARFDLGQAAMSIMLAAAGLGIGSGHSSVADQELARQVLGFPEDMTCAFLIPLGYPAGRPLAPVRVPDRRPFGEVVHRGRW